MHLVAHATAHAVAEAARSAGASAVSFMAVPPWLCWGTGKAAIVASPGTGSPRPSPVVTTGDVVMGWR